MRLTSFFILLTLIACDDDGLTPVPDPPAAAVCGDGVAEQEEVCDGEDFLGETCATLQKGEGELACQDTCRGIDTYRCRPNEGDFCDFGDTCSGDLVCNGETCVQPLCQPTERSCVANDIVLCAANQQSWEFVESCSDLHCRDAHCYNDICFEQAESGRSIEGCFFYAPRIAPTFNETNHVFVVRLTNGNAFDVSVEIQGRHSNETIIVPSHDSAVFSEIIEREMRRSAFQTAQNAAYLIRSSAPISTYIQLDPEDSFPYEQAEYVALPLHLLSKTHFGKALFAEPLPYDWAYLFSDETYCTGTLSQQEIQLSFKEYDDDIVFLHKRLSPKEVVTGSHIPQVGDDAVICEGGDEVPGFPQFCSQQQLQFRYLDFGVDIRSANKISCISNSSRDIFAHPAQQDAFAGRRFATMSPTVPTREHTEAPTIFRPHASEHFFRATRLENLPIEVVIEKVGCEDEGQELLVIDAMKSFEIAVSDCAILAISDKNIFVVQHWEVGNDDHGTTPALLLSPANRGSKKVYASSNASGFENRIVAYPWNDRIRISGLRLLRTMSFSDGTVIADLVVEEPRFFSLISRDAMNVVSFESSFESTMRSMRHLSLSR